MKAFSRIAGALAALSLLAVTARAADRPPKLDELAVKVQKHYEQVSDLSGRFEQESQVLGSRKKRTASGTVKFKKPGLMRWTYETPTKQEFISDGEKFYYYNSAEQFVAVRKLTAAFNSPTPNDFLQGLGKITDAFKISAPREGIVDSEGRPQLVLTPKEAAQANYSMTVILTKDSTDLYGVRYTDAMGSETLVRFLELKENQGVPDEAFAFKIPADVQVRQEF